MRIEFFAIVANWIVVTACQLFQKEGKHPIICNYRLKGIGALISNPP